MPEPVLIVDAAGKVRARNHAARRALAGRRGLALDAQDRLIHSLPRTARELSRRIAAAAAGVEDLRPLSARDHVGPPLLLSFRPLTIEAARFVAIFIAAAPKPTVPDESQIALRLGATPMEARVARRLATGMPLAGIANDLEVALPTVRGHLKQLYTKTGAHRQAELVGLVLSLDQPAPPG